MILFVRYKKKTLSCCPIWKPSTYSESSWHGSSFKNIWGAVKTIFIAAVPSGAPPAPQNFCFTTAEGGGFPNRHQGRHSPGGREKFRQRRMFREYSQNNTNLTGAFAVQSSFFFQAAQLIGPNKSRGIFGPIAGTVCKNKRASNRIKVHSKQRRSIC